FIDQEGVTISANNPYNPFGVDFDRFNRRLVEFGNRSTRQDVNTYRVVTGLSGAVPFMQGWNWDASLNFGRNDATELKRGNLQLSLLQNAVGPGYQDADGYHCGQPGAPIAGCV